MLSCRYGTTKRGRSIDVIVIVNMTIDSHQLAFAHAKPKAGADEAEVCLHDPQWSYDGEAVHVNSLVQTRNVSQPMWEYDGCERDSAGSGSEERKGKEVDVQSAVRSLSKRLCRRGF